MDTGGAVDRMGLTGQHGAMQMPAVDPLLEPFMQWRDLESVQPEEQCHRPDFFRNDSALSQTGLSMAGAQRSAAGMGQDYDMFQLAPAPCWAENAFLADAPPRGSELDFAFSSSAHVASRRSQAVAAAGLTSKQSSSEAAANEAFCLEDPYALFHAGRRGCEPVLPSGAQPAAHLIGPAGELGMVLDSDADMSGSTTMIGNDLFPRPKEGTISPIPCALPSTPIACSKLHSSWPRHASPQDSTCSTLSAHSSMDSLQLFPELPGGLEAFPASRHAPPLLPLPPYDFRSATGMVSRYDSLDSCAGAADPLSDCELLPVDLPAHMRVPSPGTPVGMCYTPLPLQPRSGGRAAPAAVLSSSPLASARGPPSEGDLLSEEEPEEEEDDEADPSFGTPVVAGRARGVVARSGARAAKRRAPRYGEDDDGSAVGASFGPKAARRGSAGVTKSTVSARGRAPKPRRFYSAGASSDDDASDSGNRRRKHHNPWSIEETEALVVGVERCGGGKWADIKKLGFAVIAGRSAVDLKDKWRNLMRVALLPAPGSTKAKVEKRREVPQDLLDRVRHLSSNVGAPKPQGALRGGTSSRSRRYA